MKVAVITKNLRRKHNICRQFRRTIPSKSLPLTWISSQLPINRQSNVIFANEVPQAIAGDHDEVFVAIQIDSRDLRPSYHVWLVLCVTWTKTHSIM